MQVDLFWRKGRLEQVWLPLGGIDLLTSPQMLQLVDPIQLVSRQSIKLLIISEHVNIKLAQILWSDNLILHSRRLQLSCKK